MKRAGPAAALVLLAVASYYVLVELHRPTGWGSQDTFAYFMPHTLYALDAVALGGKGLLWNPFQTYGHPFLADTVTGLLYPPNWSFLVLAPKTALYFVLIFNMFAGGLGTLLLCREIGVGWSAAVGGAVMYQLGFPMAHLTAWSPMHNGPWTWLPWALLLCERLLRAPRRRTALALGIVLALQLLPGFVLIAALTYQLIALRLAWELLTRRRAHTWRSAGAIAAGMLLGPLLVAVQLGPAVEYAGQSLRTAIGAEDVIGQSRLSVAEAWQAAAQRNTMVPFTIVPLLLAGLAPLAGAWPRHAWFFFSTAALYAVLALGFTTPLFSLYLLFPPGPAAVRVPYRLLWVSGICLTLLAALAIDGLANLDRRPRQRRAFAAVALVLGTLLCVAAPGALRRSELVSVSAVVAVVVAAAWRPRLSPLTAWLLVAITAASLGAMPLRWPGTLIPPVEALRFHDSTLSAVRARISAQDRVFLIPDFRSVTSFKLMQKTASVARLPHIFDYESLTGERIVGYFTMMRRGTAAPGLLDNYLPIPQVPPGFRRHLLDLSSVRYLLTARSITSVDEVLSLPEVELESPELRLYRNDAAFPRARFVPRIEVVEDPAALLQRLGRGGDDHRLVALVEEAPPSGFTGESSDTAGAVEFLTNDPEHISLAVDAPARGFVVLSDQYFPGWRAMVNDDAVPILRANYAFRAVEVPAGRSTVHFVYRPAPFYAGALISAAAGCFVGFALLRWRE